MRISCPVCNMPLVVPDSAAGKKGSCPNCGQRLQVPGPRPNRTMLAALDEPVMVPPTPPPSTRPDEVYHFHALEKSGGTAAVLEVVFGMFLHTFGMGHMYAGNVGVGLLFMFGYWFVLSVNVLLCFVLVGFITLPLCWVATLILSPLLAAWSCPSR